MTDPTMKDGEPGGRSGPAPAGWAADLVALLDVQAAGGDIFMGAVANDGWRRVFGGQVLAQALVAASRTVSMRPCHSLHAYFLRPGDPKIPIRYKVERTRDGSSFTVRRVEALQDDKTIFIMGASFHVPEPGLDHQLPMPEVADPESLRTERELRLEFVNNLSTDARNFLLREKPIEIRPVLALNRLQPQKHEARQMLWFKTVVRLPDDADLHRAVLAYTSDMGLLDASLLPHGVSLWSPQMQLASLDHAVWFHREFRTDEWLLYVQDSPSASGALGFNRGSIFRRDGILVASVVQEGLIRVRSAGKS